MPSLRSPYEIVTTALTANDRDWRLQIPWVSYTFRLHKNLLQTYALLRERLRSAQIEVDGSSRER